MQHRQPEQIQQRIELVLLAELFQTDPDHLIQQRDQIGRALEQAGEPVVGDQGIQRRYRDST